MAKHFDPLFSIVVASYNQESLIEQCLESLLKQQYENIELIIADDCSTDRTVEVADSWLRKYRHRFFNTEIVVHDRNQGISKNHSDGMIRTTGRFVKYIAGDDFLDSSAVENFVEFLSNEKCDWGQAIVIPYYGDRRSVDSSEFLPMKNKRRYFDYDSKKQFRLLSRGNFICAPGVFFRREALEEVGFFDPEFRMYEDWHTWLKLTLRGYAIRLLSKPLVYWRRHADSISYSAFRRGNKAYFASDLQVLNKYILPNREKLDFITRAHIRNQAEYLSNLIDYGATHKAHLQSRSIRLRDPLWWLELPDYIRNKIRNRFREVS